MRKIGNPAAAAAAGGAGGFDLAGRQISTVATSERQRLQDQCLVALIRADLVGSDQCRAAGTTAHGPSPVLALCRELVAAKVDPDRPLHAYRGDVLCLVIRSIGEAAHLDVNSKGTGFTKCRVPVRTAPPGASKRSGPCPVARIRRGRAVTDPPFKAPSVSQQKEEQSPGGSS